MKLLRHVFLKLAQNPTVMRLLSQTGMKWGYARRFIAGGTAEEALPVVRRLNRRGVLASLDVVGEEVHEPEEAARATRTYRELLRRIHREQVQANISIKLTQIGLNLNRELCAFHLSSILEQARDLNNFVRIDMESSRYTEATLSLFRECYPSFAGHVGVVIQAYLYRSREDIAALIPLGCNIRLCKGAYLEPPEIAFPEKSDVDRNFLLLLERLLGSPCYTAVATHDEKIIVRALTLLQRDPGAAARCEFQMLYGIRNRRLFQLQKLGYQTRVYIPFGSSWAPYFMRRLAERPANVLFILSNLLRR
ncbi:MAG: proline dehydrogenase family protein [Acidobacteria bacterium]|nr:proline dehydrogenase family protein [Acidobacteriota bacterium]